MKWNGDIPLYILEKRKYKKTTDENNNIKYEEDSNGDYIK
jgi:hypothetical protein